MTMTTTTMRSILLAAMAIAALFSLIVSPERSVTILARRTRAGQEMKKTESGLQYRDTKEGTGETPKTGQTCLVHYTGWLWENNAKGKEFDSSKERNAPFAFPVGKGRVIKGWDEGVVDHEGRRQAELLIPPELGYGARGCGGVIPPNATLLFEVELLGVMKKTDSGLEYRDIKVGDGPSPKPGQTCVMHYTGWLWQRCQGQEVRQLGGPGRAVRSPLGKEQGHRRLG